MDDLTDKCKELAPQVAEIMGLPDELKEDWIAAEGWLPTLAQCLDFLRDGTMYFEEGETVLYSHGVRSVGDTPLEAAYSAIIAVGKGEG